MFIRRFEECDAQAVSDLIISTLRITNRKDYPEEYLENIIKHMQPDDITERAEAQHFYVVEENDCLLGCGSIGPYRGREDESCLFTVFVHPDHQGRGIGRQIIETLEQDDFFLRAKRVEIPASITGVPFYLKMGYSFKDGVTAPNEEQLLRMEKLR